ncbi:MAG: hypothetical protein JXA67_09140, partial [Micromonosporaceae bacterium]|nr:hypothetical protein [Micromonosporaceae bacterium]
MHTIDIPTNFNWNTDPHPLTPLPATVPAEPDLTQAAGAALLSECLRDGLQGITAYPSLESMTRYVELLGDFGVTYATVGIFPGDAGAISSTIKDLLAFLREEVPAIVPSVLTPCTLPALNWTAECKEIHPALESVVFMGT